MTSEIDIFYLTEKYNPKMGNHSWSCGGTGCLFLAFLLHEHHPPPLVSWQWQLHIFTIRLIQVSCQLMLVPEPSFATVTADGLIVQSESSISVASA